MEENLGKTLNKLVDLKKQLEEMKYRVDSLIIDQSIAMDGSLPIVKKDTDILLCYEYLDINNNHIWHEERVPLINSHYKIFIPSGRKLVPYTVRTKGPGLEGESGRITNGRDT